MRVILRRAYDKAIQAANRARLLSRGTWRAGRIAFLRRRTAAFLNGRPRPLRLHLGCGNNYWPGWVNVDNRNLPQVDLAWDLNDGLPLPNESCSLIYSEHVLEHFPVNSGLALLRECHRVLAPDGTLRIAMPSLEYLVERYSSPDWRDQDWLRLPEYQFIESRAEMLNIAFRWWGHQWLYDRDELRRRLREAGFASVLEAAWGESAVADLRGRETRPDSQLICEARKDHSHGRLP